MKIKIEAEFGNDIYISIHIMLFSIILKSFKIPSIPKKKKKKKKKEPKVKLKGTEIVSILMKSTKKNEIEYFDFKGDLGFGDPAATAVMTGVTYTIVGSVIGFLSNIVDVRKTDVRINPKYNNFVIQLYAKCILKLNFVNIISAAIRLLKLYFKKRKEQNNGKSSNKRSNGNSNAKY